MRLRGSLYYGHYFEDAICKVKNVKTMASSDNNIKQILLITFRII